MNRAEPTVPVNPERLAFVGLGSNLGDSWTLLGGAMGQLERLADGPTFRSSIWESEPVDCPLGSPNFLNAVVAFSPGPGETPETLLAALQTLEREFGRRPKQVLNEARPLDLDLLVFGQQIRQSPELTLPHPRLQVRRFVLEPLVEIAPDLRLPGQSETAFQLLHRLPVHPRAWRASHAGRSF